MVMMSNGAAVIGSANLDIVVSVDRFPRPGETVLGRGLAHVPGGKGLNQAIAAARHSPTAFVGCVGSDEAGDALLSHLHKSGVDTSHVRRVDEATGRAFIHVAPDGENTIVVMTLANRQLTPESVESALDVLEPSVVIAQLEIPLLSVEAAASWASSRGARFLLNASPVQPLSPQLLSACDPLIVNVGEATSLLGDVEPELTVAGSADHTADVAVRLTHLVRSVVVTNGRHGVTVATSPQDVAHIQGLQVTPVDTTGAGDEFAGAFAAALTEGQSLTSAAQKANRAAARIVGLARSER